MQLLPQPKSLKLLGGTLSSPALYVSAFPSKSRFLSAAKTLGFTHNLSDNSKREAAKINVSIGRTTPKSGYALSINETGINISAKDEPSAYQALATLRQIQIQHPKSIPCLEIEDWPDLTIRGFMLDISRCRVPTLDRIFQLIDLLTSLKYNQLQLYTEHTFAYRNHQKVWENASPLTPEEIRQLDDYCYDRYIELVPNQNSFGHMERWLRHPEYHHLAESPNGFMHPISGWKDHGSTLRPTQDSASFVDSLYRELLPNFRSKHFNVGGDEPWELGQGYSKEEVEARGKTRVYLDHLIRIQKKVQSHRHKMQFWGDIIINKPELAKELGNEVTALLWGYEIDHPFSEHCEAMQKSKVPFTVVPGTSTWNSIGGRLQTALPNIDAASENAKRFAASGLLLTEWGDNGHHQPPQTALIPIIYAAAQAWNGKPSDDSVAFAATHLIPQCVSVSAYDDLRNLGFAAEGFSRYLHNQSWLNKILFAKPEHYSDLAKQLDAGELQLARERLEAIASEAEIGLARDILLFATDKGLSLVSEVLPSKIPRELVARFKTYWLKTSRSGGLDESVAHFNL